MVRDFDLPTGIPIAGDDEVRASALPSIGHLRFDGATLNALRQKNSHFDQERIPEGWCMSHGHIRTVRVWKIPCYLCLPIPVICGVCGSQSSAKSASPLSFSYSSRPLKCLELHFFPVFELRRVRRRLPSPPRSTKTRAQGPFFVASPNPRSDCAAMHARF